MMILILLLIIPRPSLHRRSSGRSSLWTPTLLLKVRRDSVTHHHQELLFQTNAAFFLSIFLRDCFTPSGFVAFNRSTPTVRMKMMMTTTSLECKILKSMTILVALMIQRGDAFQSFVTTTRTGPSGIRSMTQTWAVSSSRRAWMSDIMQKSNIAAVTFTAAAVIPFTTDSNTAWAAPSSEGGEQFDPNDPEFADVYDNPAIPPAPEERSGLVVLRVAEVAQFQEKILRAIVDGTLPGVMVSPMQFAFGTQILLRNSNLDGNMKLMIDTEIPKQNRPLAIKNAVNAMNTLQDIAKYSASIQRDFEPLEMVALADMYKSVRINLNQLYEYLPAKEQDKYYGYMVAVTEYEKKIANGTYNPDIDGVLKFDD